MENFSTRFKFALDKKGISQSELSRRIGVTRGAISFWLNGDVQTVNGNRLITLASALDVDPTWLATGQGPMESTGIILSDDERKLLESIRQLSRQKQKIVFSTADTLINCLLK